MVQSFTGVSPHCREGMGPFLVETKKIREGEEKEREGGM